MSTVPENCNQCGKRQKQDSAQLHGSFTQWIFSQELCDCQARKDQKPEHQDARCQTCGNKKFDRRSGSITQWVFNESPCNCIESQKDAPPVAVVGSEADAHAGAKNDQSLVDYEAGGKDSEQTDDEAPGQPATPEVLAVPKLLYAAIVLATIFSVVFILSALLLLRSPSESPSSKISTGGGAELLNVILKQDGDRMIAGIKQDKTKEAAENGSAYSQWEVGNRLRYREEPDYKGAFQWYSKAAAQKEPRAMYELGVLYTYGFGVEKDYAKAAKLFLESSEQGNVRAETMAGAMYRDGRGVQQDYKKAAKFFARAAEGGWTNADVYLAALYIKGNGVRQDYSEAMRLYRKAADKGNPQAFAGIGWMYFKGLGVRQNYGEAMKWYLLAADHDNAEAQTSIGYMYENGLGVPKDERKAISWYRQAASQGYSAAQVHLSKLSGR